MDVKDTNGNLLSDGDAVTVVKDLKLRGSSEIIKRGTLVKNIKLTDDPTEIDCKVNKTAIVLRTEFVKKAN
jgi:protein PhnA